MNKVELQNLVGGQLQEKFERAFESVIENLQDPNTSLQDMNTKFYIGKDLRTGEVYAEEYGKQIRGQMSLNLNDSKAEKQTEVVDGTVVDTETGEILSGKNENVVDFRKAAK